MIALFGALSFAMSQGSRTSSTMATAEAAKLAATEIMEYANAVQNAVKALKIQGCQDNQFNFRNAVTDAIVTSGTNPFAPYINASTPANGSCDVFGANGGKINFVLPPDNAQIDSLITNANFISRKMYVFTSKNSVWNIGTTNVAELVILLPALRLEVCQSINTMLKNEGSIDSTVNLNPDNPYDGTYADWGDIDGAALHGKKAGCAYDTDASDGNGGKYIFYQVLIAR